MINQPIFFRVAFLALRLRSQSISEVTLKGICRNKLHVYLTTTNIVNREPFAREVLLRLAIE